MNFHPLKRRHRDCFLAGLCLITLAIGCSQAQRPDYESLGLAEVTGTIRLDEKPLANANVIFEAPDKSYSYGKTNSSGKYTLMFNSEQPGVLPGQKIVRIQLRKFSQDDSDRADEEATDREEPMLEEVSAPSELPSTYHRNSQLTATVTAGVHTIDFDLKSAGPRTTTTK